MIKIVADKNDVKYFVNFIKDLYRNDEHFVLPLLATLKKELVREILVKKRYFGLLCIKDNKIAGRLLFTVSDSKQKQKKIGYFSFFDCVNDYEVAKELFSAMENQLKGKVDYIEGTFAPYDPDTRRGILVSGFDEPHTFLTSYNYPYYKDFLEKLGYTKAYDTVTLKIPLVGKNAEAVKLLAERAQKSQNLRIDDLDLKNIDRDINDVHEILKIATFELNYQDAPSIALIRKVVKNLKFFLEPRLIKILREKDTNRPLGFCLVLLDYNQIFKKTKGRINIIRLLFGKRKITGARGILQYLIPEYQGTGAFTLVFWEIYQTLKSLGINYFEGGTIMEDNKKSVGSLMKTGGEISKVYRLYGKEI